MSGSIQTPFCQSTLWSSEPGRGVRKKNSRISSGNSRLMISMSRRIDSLVSAGKAEDIAGIGDGAVLAPFLQHLAIFGDLVLPFLGRDQVVGVDVLEPDEDAAHAGLCRLLDEIRNLVAERVDLDGEAEFGNSVLRRCDDPIEQHFPVAVAREIVVRDEEALMFCAWFSRMILSTSSGVRQRLLRPCTLMIVQNEHW